MRAQERHLRGDELSIILADLARTNATRIRAEDLLRRPDVALERVERGLDVDLRALDAFLHQLHGLGGHLLAVLVQPMLRRDDRGAHRRDLVRLPIGAAPDLAIHLPDLLARGFDILLGLRERRDLAFELHDALMRRIDLRFLVRTERRPDEAPLEVEEAPVEVHQPVLDRERFRARIPEAREHDEAALALERLRQGLDELL